VVSVVSNVGCFRSNNEDNFLLNGNINKGSIDAIEYGPYELDKMWNCMAVFDGMGGGEKGELAALFAAEEFCSTLPRLELCKSRNGIDCLMQESFLRANRRIVEYQKKSNMYGTTGTVLCTDREYFKIYHLGDSRAYLFRDNDLFKLTKDQTLAEMKIELGLYDSGHPNGEKEKHQLTEYIGCDSTLENLHPQESLWIPFQDEDKLLLCTDGLYDMCSDSEISKIMRNSAAAETIAKQLTECAIRNGGKDNITCLIVG